MNLYRNYAFKYYGTGCLLNADYGEGQTAVDKSDFDVTGISNIYYNLLNLPKTIVKSGTSVQYIYSAMGEKLQTILPGKTINYNGGFVYEDGALQYILNEEGRYSVNGVNSGYEYNLKDHLGNVRMVINSSGDDVQTNNYYPFGGVFAKYSSSNNKYQFNGKELQEETDWLDYGFRMYDNRIGRWMCQDPMAERRHNISHSPYNYCVNNPVNYIDPDGLDWFYRGGGEFTEFLYLDGVSIMTKDHIKDWGTGWGNFNNGEKFFNEFGSNFPFFYLPDGDNYKSAGEFKVGSETFWGALDWYVQDLNFNYVGGADAGVEDGRIDLSNTGSPFYDVVTFMRDIRTDLSSKGPLSDYIVPSTVNGEWKHGLRRSENPLIVKGHPVLMILQFDERNYVTRNIGHKAHKALSGRYQYRIILYGTSTENLGGRIKPHLINIIMTDSTFHRSVVDYISGKSNTY